MKREITRLASTNYRFDRCSRCVTRPKLSFGFRREAGSIWGLRMSSVNPTTTAGPLTTRFQTKASESTIQKTPASPPGDSAAAGRQGAGFRAFEVLARDEGATTGSRPATGPQPSSAAGAHRRGHGGAPPTLSFTQLRECRTLVILVQRVAVLRAEIAKTERDRALFGGGTSPDPATTSRDVEARRAELEAALCQAEAIAIEIASGVPNDDAPIKPAAANRPWRAPMARRRPFLWRPAFRVAAACAIVLAAMTSVATGSVFGRPARGVSDQALPALVSTAGGFVQAGSPGERLAQDPWGTTLSGGSGIVFYPEEKSSGTLSNATLTTDPTVLVVPEEEQALETAEEDAGSPL